MSGQHTWEGRMRGESLEWVAQWLWTLTFSYALIAQYVGILWKRGDEIFLHCKLQLCWGVFVLQLSKMSPSTIMWTSPKLTLFLKPATHWVLAHSHVGQWDSSHNVMVHSVSLSIFALNILLNPSTPDCHCCYLSHTLLSLQIFNLSIVAIEVSYLVLFSTHQFSRPWENPICCSWSHHSRQRGGVQTVTEKVMSHQRWAGRSGNTWLPGLHACQTSSGCNRPSQW